MRGRRSPRPGGRSVLDRRTGRRSTAHRRGSRAPRSRGPFASPGRSARRAGAPRQRPERPRHERRGQRDPELRKKVHVE
ncbi:MAG: hypothetical protein DMF83_04895 [Acidobacteria bacterium]|nr:MAG: hypothetical protein DMF83_04895 [Acidobacteriota bacterium]